MGEKSIPTISVLIPTRNGEATLPELLAMLSIQTVPIAEIVVADSASRDRTVAIAEQYGATVLTIDPATFDHGGTRTLMAQRAKGDILVFFTQDAVPKRRDAIERLIAPLLQDGNIVTCYGRQLPSFDADFFAASLRKFNYTDEGAVRAMEDARKWGMKVAFTSNSFASYRKSALESIGFFQNGLIFGEDTIAVGRFLENGMKIAYVPEAMVYHSHNYSPAEEFKRYFDIGVLHASQQWFLERFGSAEGQGRKYIHFMLSSLYKEKQFGLLPELLLRLVWKYCGYRLGRYHRKLPNSLIPQLSLHRSWWLKL